MLHFINFHIFTAGVVQTVIFWVLTLCSAAGWNRCFEEMCCLYLRGLRNWYWCVYHEDEVILHMQTAKNRVNHNQMMQIENFLIYILINEVYHSLFTSPLLEPRKVPCTSTHAHARMHARTHAHMRMHTHIFTSQPHCFTVPIHPSQVLSHCPVAQKHKQD